MVATKGRGWGLAPCLVDLIDEADDRKPNRSHAADGSIGDRAHAARASDHNPVDGWVCAVDVDDDHDSDQLGVDLLRAHLVATKDPRVKYLIRNGTIWKAYPNRGLLAWTPQPYTGANAHRKHLHVSIHNTPAARNDTSPWWPTEENEDDMTPEQVQMLKDVKALASKAAMDAAAAKKIAQEIFDRQVPEQTVREDIALTRKIADKLDVP